MAGRPESDLLRKPTTALLGVSAAAASALKSFHVTTIFDLATRDVFENARKIPEAGNDPKSFMYQHGSATADLIRESVVGGTKFDQLPYLNIAALERVPEAAAPAIATALDVSNSRDLAMYPPHKAAMRILDAAYFPENSPGFDADQPADLLPTNGDYPTERVQYTTLVMDEIKIDTATATINILADTFTPLDLIKIAGAEAGFQNIAFGALLTLTQSWYAQRVPLGNLLHSVSLAPGESTRMAVVDWTRKSSAGQADTIVEADELANETSHNRTMNEVNQATATDAQSGFSASRSSASAQQVGVAASAVAQALQNRDCVVRSQLILNRNRVRFPLELPAVTQPKGKPTEPMVVLNFKTAGIGAEVKNYLQNNRMYYSTAVFRSLDATQIALLLSGCVIKIKQRQANGRQLKSLCQSLKSWNLNQYATLRNSGMAQMVTGGSPNFNKGGQNISQDGANVNYFDQTQGQSEGGSGLEGQYSQYPAAIASLWGGGMPRSDLIKKVSSQLHPGYYGPTGRAEIALAEKALRDAKDWADLISFTPPNEVFKDLKARNMKLQPVEDVTGNHTNFDHYAVRKSMKSYVDTDYSFFTPYTASDKSVWETDTPYRAAIRIDIGFDNAAVFVSDARANRWRFSTITTEDRGTHPVSGTREFGVGKSATGYPTIYTRGVDRLTTYAVAAGYWYAFSQADKLWRSF
ncbi:MAG: hypothetical protein Q9210_002563 [Variospora velana]